MELVSLLHRASELAPGWCKAGHGGFKIGDSPFIRTGWLTDSDRALILYAVLTECEKRGLELQSSTASGPFGLEYRYWFRRSVPAGAFTDPATAALAAFVSLLESEVTHAAS